MIEPAALSLAAQNVELLRAIDGGGHATKAALAAALGRDPSNLNRSLKALTDGGLMDSAAIDGGLNAVGRNALAAVLDAAGAATGEDHLRPDCHPRNGAAVIGDGPMLLLHSQIVPDPLNARRDWDSAEATADLEGLADSIATQGLMQNLTVRGPLAEAEATPLAEAHGITHALGLYRLVGGERRWRAIGRLIAEGLWPADRPIPCRPLDGDDLDIQIAALSENILRRDLNPVEKCEAFERLAQALIAAGRAEDKVNGEIAVRIGKTPEHIQQHRRLAKLDDADRARMILPRDDPRRLTLREARLKLARQDENRLPELSDAARLILVELAHYSAAMKDGRFGAWVRVDSSVQADETLRELDGVVYTNGPQHWSDDIGHYQAYIAYSGHSLTRAQAPWIDEDEAARDQGLDDVHAALDVRPADGDRYVTPWLNGPFELTDEGRQRIETARAEAEAQEKARKEAAIERQRAAERAALMRTHAEGLLKQSRAAPAVTEALDGARHIFDQLGRPLPMRAFDTGIVQDANGEEVADFTTGWGPATDDAVALAMTFALAVNHAAGVETPELATAADLDAEDGSDCHPRADCHPRESGDGDGDQS